MSKVLTEAERLYLRGLRDTPTWLRILEKLRSFAPPPVYKPGKTEQFEKWIYESGRHNATEGMLQILYGQAIKLDLGGSDEPE